MSENKFNTSIAGKRRRKYDAIVVGSGISGGWAAKELCEAKLKTLVLERGGPMDHLTDYKTANVDPWDFPNRNLSSRASREQNPIQSKCYAWNEGTQHLFVEDQKHPYEQVKPFDWIRGYHVGGKSIMWARQCYRWGPQDFEANAKDGVGVDWPIRYEDLEPWYSYVETFAGISGNKDGIPHLPDSEFLPPMDMNCVEEELARRLKVSHPDRSMIIGRSANYTARVGNRGPCQYRNLCHRGCPFSGYFNSNSATLPAAAATGKMTLKTHSIVHSVIYDERKQKAKGVRVIDALTGAMTEYYAKIIFLNASTIGTAAILLNSTNNRFPNGLGNDYDMVGRHLMVHNYRVRFGGEVPGFLDKTYTGRRPNSCYIPRFRNIGDNTSKDFLRGYALSIGASREGWYRGMSRPDFGPSHKDQLCRPGPWTVYMHAMGETLPHPDNRVTLHGDQVDDWGMPIVQVDCEWQHNDESMCKDMLTTGAEMLETMGVKDIEAKDSKQAPGLDIHEMGTARMGRDPKTSVLNGFNQVHACKNVFVTDGAAMTSSACQNPSLTFMALTARACNFAVESLKSGDLK